MSLIQRHDGTAVLSDSNGPRCTFIPQISLASKDNNATLPAMTQPPLTPLQFAVIDCLRHEGDEIELTGAELRDALKRLRQIEKSGPAFYQLMSRLLDSRLVVSSTRKNETVYSVSESGIKAHTETQRFYEDGAR